MYFYINKSKKLIVTVNAISTLLIYIKVISCGWNCNYLLTFPFKPIALGVILHYTTSTLITSAHLEKVGKTCAEKLRSNIWGIMDGFSYFFLENCFKIFFKAWNKFFPYKLNATFENVYVLSVVAKMIIIGKCQNHKGYACRLGDILLEIITKSMICDYIVGG